MRIRVRFAKVGKVRWTSHRDVARTWERAFRRSSVPVAYSGGYSPGPRISFGLALPTGCESLAEYLDVEVAPDAEIDLDVVATELSGLLPVGVDVVAIAALEEHTASLQQEVTSCEWLVQLTERWEPTAAGLVEEVLSAPSLPVIRRRKGKRVSDDLRPGIVSLAAASDHELVFVLATRPRGVRPTEVLAAVRPELEIGLVRRTNQWIERDGARLEPERVALAATDAPHARLRAS